MSNRKEKIKNISGAVVQESVYGVFSNHKGIINQTNPVKSFITDKSTDKLMTTIKNQLLTSDTVLEVASLLKKNPIVGVANGANGYLGCVSDEYDYLKRTDQYNFENINLARSSCMTHALMDTVVPQTFLKKLGYEGVKSGVDVMFESQYKNNSDIFLKSNLSNS